MPKTPTTPTEKRAFALVTEDCPHGNRKRWQCILCVHDLVVAEYLRGFSEARQGAKDIVEQYEGQGIEYDRGVMTDRIRALEPEE